MFPEYAEKYEQQQLSNQLVPEQVSQVPTQQENSTPLLDKKGDSKQEDQNKVEAPRDLKNRVKKSIPTWMLLLLVSIFGAVMALPLLQLRHWDIKEQMILLGDREHAASSGTSMDSCLSQ